MAASGDFFTGDDLDDLFSLIDGGFLDGNDEFNSEINSIVNEVATDEGNTASFKGLTPPEIAKFQNFF